MPSEHTLTAKQFGILQRISSSRTEPKPIEHTTRVSIHKLEASGFIECFAEAGQKAKFRRTESGEKAMRRFLQGLSRETLATLDAARTPGALSATDPGVAALLDAGLLKYDICGLQATPWALTVLHNRQAGLARKQKEDIMSIASVPRHHLGDLIEILSGPWRDEVYEGVGEDIPVGQAIENELRRTRNPESVAQQWDGCRIGGGDDIGQWLRTIAKIVTTVKTEKYDADVYRLVRYGKIVGFALRHSNGSWGAYDSKDVRLTKATFQTPKKVATWMNEYLKEQDKALSMASDDAIETRDDKAQEPLPERLVAFQQLLDADFPVDHVVREIERHIEALKALEPDVEDRDVAIAETEIYLEQVRALAKKKAMADDAEASTETPAP